MQLDKQLGETLAAFQAEFEDMEGQLEFRYQRHQPDTGIGWLRMSPDNKWMYAKVPVMRWDGKTRADFKTHRPYATGEFLYYRHKSQYARYSKPNKYAEYYAKIGNLAKVLVGPDDGWAVKHAESRINYRVWPKVFTVEDCKREIQANHPDKGGDPAVCQLWVERLDKARRAAA